MAEAREIRWTVALEASLFFSVPSWLLMERGWPGDHPDQFVVAVLGGASLALVLCHVAPALCAPAISRLAGHGIGRWVMWPAGAWFCVGAAVSLGQIARLGGGMVVLWRNQPDHPGWGTLAAAVALIFAALAAGIAWQGVSRHRLAIGGCLALGVALVAVSCGAQWAGMAARSPSMVSEAGLNSPQLLLEGILLAAAPVSILAFRLGRMELPAKRIWWTGLSGVWLPLIASATLLSLSKMCGARLYWRPSLPIQFDYAFAWLFQKTNHWAIGLWPLSLTLLAPCIVCALWVRELTGNWERNWRTGAMLLGLAGIAWWILSPFAWAQYYSYWLRLILWADALAGLVWLAWLAVSRILHARDAAGRM